MEKRQDFPIVKYFNPLHLAIFSAGLALLFMIVGKITGTGGIMGSPIEFPWVAGTACILLYMIFTAMGSVMSEDVGAYWKKAVPLFIGLMALNSGLAYLFSSTWITEVGGFTSIYIILLFGYLVLQAMSRLIKFILSYASEDHEKNG